MYLCSIVGARDQRTGGFQKNSRWKE